MIFVVLPTIFVYILSVSDACAVVDVIVAYPVDLQQEGRRGVIFAISEIVLIEDEFAVNFEPSPVLTVVPVRAIADRAAVSLFEYGVEEVPVGLQNASDALCGAKGGAIARFLNTIEFIPFLIEAGFGLGTAVGRLGQRAEHGRDAVARLANADPVKVLVGIVEVVLYIGGLDVVYNVALVPFGLGRVDERPGVVVEKGELREVI